MRESLRRSLSFNGYSVALAEDGVEALDVIAADRPDAVVLDVMMPRLDGLEVCRQLRSTGDDLPILVLTARDSISERVAGLDAGADDYLPKPCRFAELVARIHALARRATPSRPPVLQHGDIELDPARRQVTRNGRDVDLTRKEFGVLEVLMSAEGATVSAEELLERVWDEHTDPFTNVVRMTIMTLRRKLGDPPVVETVIGVGYRMN